jgi:hypothetical protein
LIDFVQICHLLNWVVRKLTEVEMQMNAVERMTYYANIEREPIITRGKSS